LPCAGFALKLNVMKANTLMRTHQAPRDQAGGAGPEITSFTLENGLDVVVIPDRRVPVVTHMVWYRTGSADDPIGQSGIAHFLEHLMFKGTDKHPAGEFSKVVAALGGQENAFTSYDYTAYYQRVAKEHLGTMMAYEADRMRGLVLDEAVVGPERDVVLEERRMRVETDPGAQLSEAMASSLFVHHPYGIPIIGWMHEIETLNRDHALHHYRRFYAPNNAILVVAGDVSAAEVRHLAENTYGVLASSGPRPVRLRPREPDPCALRAVSVMDDKVEQPILQKLYLTPSSLTASNADSYALEVLAEVLGGGPASYLYRKLVLDEGVAVNTGSWYMGSAMNETRFSLYGVPNEDVTLEALEERMDNALRKALDEAFTPQALERGKTRLIADTIYASDSQSSLARVYGAALAIGETIEDVQLWPAKIEAVTRDEMAHVLESYLVPRRSVTGYLRRKGGTLS
jgi:zinc protease